MYVPATAERFTAPESSMALDRDPDARVDENLQLDQD